ncbi:MAG: 16S rRNA (cytidine(1402)-2'-O)-methyltransferase [Acutalibacteraceae bacterium]
MAKLKIGVLYVVGTPIGNLRDFSPRAVETLTDADFIAAEDTRVTRKLLTHFEIHTPMISYYEHNKMERGPEIVARIQNGESCALVTDAGMPAISDPGQDLVDRCLRAGLPVVSVPGPTAFATAVALSGMDSTRFTFVGFLAVDKKKRREQLDFIKKQTCTVVLYEAPHKLSATLQDLYSTLGDRQMTILRELTKVHEDIIRLSLAEAVERYPNNNLRGELVLVLEGGPDEKQKPTLEDAVKRARYFMENGMAASAAAKLAAKESGIKKGDIYRNL